ncbi:hypothetical protein COX97_02345 [Candidatus Pacearchaeota archaeon CG_4_10_14_0_2_um_filter_05_32_18]|nr:MAG: hypothetical protein COX97_02345 [Candidatus Pacearchaeota archaeon CG_4_10_14_0_2_um_filter_05_32_18]
MSIKLRKESVKFWSATFTLTGTVVGAGILGLPYVFSKSGFFIGLFWILFLGAVIILSKLYLGEVVLRTKETHQLPGYAGKYLGKWGKRVMVFEMIFGVYSALIAYLIGEGQSFSKLFTGSSEHILLFTIGFWLLMTLLLGEGLRGLKKVGSWGVTAVLVIVLGMFIWYFPGVKMENIYSFDVNYIFLPFGVVLFALLGFSAIPELKRELKGSEKLMKKAIFVGALIPVIVYILFSFIFVATLGKDVPEVATLSFGKIVLFLGVFTMLTSYFVLSFALKDMFKFDFNYSKAKTFILVSILPLLIFTILYYLDLLEFVGILGFAGVISAGVTGILIALMNLKAKKKGNRKPEYSMRINKLIVILIIAVFVLGVLAEFGVLKFVLDFILNLAK